MLKYNIEGGTATADTINSSSCFGMIKQYVPGMKRLGEYYSKILISYSI